MLPHTSLFIFGCDLCATCISKSNYFKYTAFSILLQASFETCCFLKSRGCTLCAVYISIYAEVSPCDPLLQRSTYILLINLSRHFSNVHEEPFTDCCLRTPEAANEFCLQFQLHFSYMRGEIAIGFWSPYHNPKLFSRYWNYPARNLLRKA